MQISPKQRNQYGQTYAMFLAEQNQSIPQNFLHDPSLQDNNGNTVAMLYAQNGIQAPREWTHDPNIRNSLGQTVQMILNNTYQNQNGNSLLIQNSNPYIQNQQQQIKQFEINNINKITTNQQIRIQHNYQSQTQNNFVFNQEQQIPIYNIQQDNINPQQQLVKYTPIKNNQEMFLNTGQQNNYYIQQNQNNPGVIIDVYKNTRAMKMIIELNMMPRPQDYHDPTLQNKFGDTVALLLAQKGQGLQIPQQWYHDPQIANNKGQTVQHIMQQQGLIVPQQWQIIQTVNTNNINYQIIYPKNNKIEKLLNQYCVQYKIQNKNYVKGDFNKDGHAPTFAQYLAYNSIRDIPQVWQHDPLLQTRGKWTVAMSMAKNKIIPPKEWNHRPDIKNKYGNTVAMILAVGSISIPKQWNHSSTIRNTRGQTVALIIARSGYKQKQNGNSITYIPPAQWRHHPTLKDNTNHTVKYYLLQHKVEVPLIWDDEQLQTINKNQNVEKKENVEKEQTNKIQKKPLQLDENGNSPAMLDAKNGKIPQPEDQHDTKLQNKDGDTVATILAEQGIIPPVEWYYDSLMINKKQQNVQYLLQKMNIEVPKMWKNDQYIDENGNTMAMLQAQQGAIPTPSLCHDQQMQNKRGQTVAMILASKGIEPPSEWQHDPTLTDKNNCTVAMFYAFNHIIPPQEWKHAPELQYNDEVKIKNGDTVALLLSRNNTEQQIKDGDIIIPQKEWCHQPLLSNNDGQTVAIQLALQQIVPPQEWQHNLSIQDKSGRSLMNIIQREIYQFMCKIKYQEGECCVCYAEGYLDFLDTTCTHKVCVRCLKNMINVGNHRKCPMCNNQNWLKYNKPFQGQYHIQYM